MAFVSRPEYGKRRPSNKMSGFPSHRIGAAFGLADSDVRRVNVFRTEWVPDESRYFFTPILPFHATPEERSAFDHVVRAERFDSAEDVREFLGRFYPPDRSEAYAVLVGDTGVVLNTTDWMKKSEPEAFSLDLTKGPVDRITGEVTYREYIIAKQNEDRLFIHTNDYMEETTELRLRVEGRPDVRVEPESAVDRRQWAPEKGELSLDVGHEEGVVRLWVER